MLKIQYKTKSKWRINKCNQKTNFIQGGFILKKFIDTSNLAIYQSGKYQGKFDWINNIGKELYFEYQSIISIAPKSNPETCQVFYLDRIVYWIVMV